MSFPVVHIEGLNLALPLHQLSWLTDDSVRAIQNLLAHLFFLFLRRCCYNLQWRQRSLLSLSKEDNRSAILLKLEITNQFCWLQVLAVAVVLLSNNQIAALTDLLKLAACLAESPALKFLQVDNQLAQYAFSNSESNLALLTIVY